MMSRSIKVILSITRVPSHFYFIRPAAGGGGSGAVRRAIVLVARLRSHVIPTRNFVGSEEGEKVRKSQKKKSTHKKGKVFLSIFLRKLFAQV